MVKNKKFLYLVRKCRYCSESGTALVGVCDAIDSALEVARIARSQTKKYIEDDNYKVEDWELQLPNAIAIYSWLTKDSDYHIWIEKVAKNVYVDVY